MVEYKCRECGETFNAKTEKKAFEKLKKHRKKEHMKNTSEEDLRYIS